MVVIVWYSGPRPCTVPTRHTCACGGSGLERSPRASQASTRSSVRSVVSLHRSGRNTGGTRVECTTTSEGVPRATLASGRERTGLRAAPREKSVIARHEQRRAGPPRRADRELGGHRSGGRGVEGGPRNQDATSISAKSLFVFGQHTPPIHACTCRCKDKN